MQPFPISYMPTVPPPCFSLRSRREVNAADSQNSRLVEHWQTDSPSLINARRDIRGTSRYQDMNPTPSRLYREDMRQSQPYVVEAENPARIQDHADIDAAMSRSFQEINTLTQALTSARSQSERDRLTSEISNRQDLYTALLQRKQQADIDNLTSNPYFEKYDVQGDTRNIIRELQSVVTEDIVDRGLEQSQKLIRRGMESRWLPAHFAESQGLDTLSAYDLMRPKFNKQEKTYH